jgi:ADP-heptose:LPS heptosyltransferase
MSVTARAEWLPSFARVKSFAWAARKVVAAGGFPDIGFYFNGGVGDELMCSAVARELKQRGAGKIWVFTSAPEVFAGNPDLIAVPADWRLHRFCDFFRVARTELEYPSPPKQHLIATMCAIAGIEGEIALRPYVHLRDEEKRGAKRTKRPQIAIQTSSMAARYPMKNKQWPHERFQSVADALGADFDLVQLGAPDDPVLRGCLDLRGKTKLREAAAIMASSELFIGLVSGLMHLARAVDCPAVIVYGGREHPSQSGYVANENLYWEGPCSPCWLRNDCDYDRRCLSGIAVEAVIAAARRRLAQGRESLAVERLTLAPKG